MPTSGLLSDRYLIEKEIGRGGFGVVYLAHDQRLLSKPVVVKVLEEASADPWLQKKFRQEMEALARIDHPGVVGVLDLGETPQGKPFLVMQFVEGVTLRSLLHSPGMEFARAAGILRQIGQALGAAHDKGVYHRDLKPENIMLEHAGEAGEFVKLIDFGIAAVRDSQVAAGTQSSQIAGSFAYMAPEQLLGQASPASDIWALGVVAFEMLTARRPELLPDGVKEKPADLRPGLPDRAQAAILKALSFHPKDRYASPRDFVQELADALTAAGPSPAAAPTTTHHPPSTSPGLEMAYVLFMDLVGFSATTMDRQAHTIQLLQRLVRDTPEFQRALAADQLVSLPTGDGMALVFFHNPVAAVQCAVEVARAIKAHPELRLRLGVHAGPVYRIADINTNRNVTGGGINLAQRVMDCGDHGHILLSKNVADVLSQLGDWAPHLHDLGEAQVKHGVKMHLVNLCTGEVGNQELPEKLRKSRTAAPSPPTAAPAAAPKSHRGLYIAAGAALVVVIAVFSATQLLNRRDTKTDVSPASLAPQSPVDSSRSTAGSPPPVTPPPAAPPAASGSTSPAPTPAVATPPASPPSAKPSASQAPAVVPSRTRVTPPQPVQQTPAQSAPAPSTPPSQTPAAAAPPPPPAESSALAELRERFIFLGARAGAVRSSLQNLARQQQASGLSLRADMAAAQARVDYLMGEANAALGRRDADAAKRNLDLAERDVEKLERFLGR